MGRPPNQELVRRVLEALAILRSEPGWHPVAELAAAVGAPAARLADDLRRTAYAAGTLTLPLRFGDDDDDDPHPAGGAVVRLDTDVPVALPLPISRVGLTRYALLADAAVRLDPTGPAAAVLTAFRDRVTAWLGVRGALDVRLVAPAPVAVLRDAIDRSRAVRFPYRALDADAVGDRTVTPDRVWRDGPSWLLLAHDHDRGATRTFRVDRITGPVEDAGPSRLEPAEGGADRDGGAGRSPIAQRTAVRLRIGADEQWVVDGHDPVGHIEDGAMVEVTIHLYPPVGARLSRLLFLLRPGASIVRTDAPGGPDGLLTSHRAALARLGDLYRNG